MQAYLDNAATTKIDPEVFQVMSRALMEYYGNPSSSHALGRTAKGKMEQARKKVAQLFNASAMEIVFTSGATESNNLAIQSVLNSGKITQVITTDIEHHAVLDTIEFYCHQKKIKLSKVKLDEQGNVDLEDLALLLKEEATSFVSLMHANNEIGNLLPIEKVASLCMEYGAVFHCDTVQTIGHYVYDLQKMNIDFITCSAHKIHGPKGVGFLYVNKKNKLNPLFLGGNQERGVRAGTENVAAIMGLATALEIAYQGLEENEQNISLCRQQLMNDLKTHLPGVVFNGNTGDSLSTILNVELPTKKATDVVLFQLDLKGVCVSGGSACSSGSLKGSHVLSAFKKNLQNCNLRLSISRYTTQEEISYAVECLKEVADN